MCYNSSVAMLIIRSLLDDTIKPVIIISYVSENAGFQWYLSNDMIEPVQLNSNMS